MTITREYLQAFNRFAMRQIAGNHTGVTLDELVARWYAAQHEQEDTLNELSSCAKDMEAGIGRAFDQVDADLRRKHGFGTRDSA